MSRVKSETLYERFSKMDDSENDDHNNRSEFIRGLVQRSADTVVDNDLPFTVIAQPMSFLS
jgi:hypothetical protein